MPTARNSVSLLPILSVNFVGTLGFSIVLPFLVFLVTEWGGNALVYGLMGATYSAFQLVGAPVLGRWSDRVGRRRVLLVSQIGTLVSWLIFLTAMVLPVDPLLEVDSHLVGRFTLTLPLVVLFLARAIDGVTGGNVSVANAYLADVSDEEDRNANFGKMAVSTNLGFVLGPVLAGVLGATAWGARLPVLAALSISLVATLLIWRGLPESKPCVLARDPEHTNVRKVFGQEQKECFRMAGPRVPIGRLLATLPCVRPLLAANFLVMLGFNFFYVAFPIHAVTNLGWSVAQTGTFFAAMGLMMVVVQGPVLARASRRWSDGALAVAGSLVLAASFAFYVSPDPLTIYAGTALLALGNGLMWPSLSSLLSKAAGEESQGAVQGFASSAGSVASILGLLAGGVLFEGLASRLFLLSAASILMVFALTLWIRRKPEVFAA